jgi:glycosyltransferase involved in cell wall biosynthesis
MTSATLRNAKSIGLHPGRPLLDLDNSDSELIVREAASFKPDVIHIHSILGIPVKAIEPLSKLAPVLFSMHEYFFICQRGNLVTSSGENCSSFITGSGCAACVNQVVSPGKHRARALLHGLPLDAGRRAIQLAERVSKRDLKVSPPPQDVLPSADPRSAEESKIVKEYRQRTSESVSIVNECCTEVLAVSNSVRQILIDAGLDEAVVSVLHIGSSSAESTPRMPVSCLEEGRDPRFIFFGGFNPGKGSKVLLDALAQMDNPPEIEWMGPTDRGTEDAAERERAPDSVSFRGKVARSEVIAALSRADVMLAPSVAHDTSPQAVLESLAAGRPVIGARTGGIPDFIEDGGNGLLIEPNNPTALRIAMEKLRDSRVLEQLASGVRAPLSVDEHITQLERRYESAGQRRLSKATTDSSQGMA